MGARAETEGGVYRGEVAEASIVEWKRRGVLSRKPGASGFPSGSAHITTNRGLARGRCGTSACNEERRFPPGEKSRGGARTLPKQSLVLHRGE